MEEDDVGQYYQPANDKTGCYSATVLKCHSATTSKCQTSPVDALPTTHSQNLNLNPRVGSYSLVPSAGCWIKGKILNMFNHISDFICPNIKM